MLKPDWPIISQVATAAAAIIAIVASYRSSSRQLNASKEIALRQIDASRDQVNRQVASAVLSANRQAWINDLRTTLAQFIAAVHHSTSALLLPPDQRDFNRIADGQRECYLYLTRIRLLINGQEEDHRNLVILANSMYDAVVGASRPKIMEIESALVLHAQSILKREWERVKALT
jgi:hypothetical protein